MKAFLSRIRGKYGRRFGGVEPLEPRYLLAAGDTLWYRQYPSPDGSDDSATAVAVAADNSVYIAGTEEWHLPDGTGGRSGAVRKLDRVGNPVWSRRFDQGGNFTDVAVDPAGDVVACGFSFYTVNGTQVGHVVVRKYSPTGDVRWTRQYAAPAGYAILPGTISTDALGEIYLVSRSYPGDGTREYPVTLRKLSPTGQLRWAQTYAPALPEVYSAGAAVDRYGNSAVVIPGLGGPDNSTAVHVRFHDQAGRLVRTASLMLKQYAALSPGSASFDDQGNLLIGYHANGTWQTPYEARLVKVGLAGQVLWDRPYGDSADNLFFHTAPDPAGGLAIAGYSEDPDESPDSGWYRAYRGWILGMDESDGDVWMEEHFPYKRVGDSYQFHYAQAIAVGPDRSIVTFGMYEGEDYVRRTEGRPLPGQDVAIVATDARAAEGGDTARFTLTRTARPGGSLAAALDVPLKVTGSASAFDFRGIPAIVHFASGQSSVSLTLSGVADMLSEPAETVSLIPRPGEGYTISWKAPAATATITNALPGGIAGTLYHDLNGNRVKDTTELGLASWTVYLDADKDGRFDAGERSAVTNASGAYRFWNLPPGGYRVRPIVQAGFMVTTPAYFDPTVGTAVALGKNFGLAKPVSISGTIFRDLNADRLKGTGETGLSGWKIFIDADKDGILDVGELWATTDALGTYKFTNIKPGMFSIRVIVPAGYTATTPLSLAKTLTSGQTASGLLFGAR